MDLQRAVPNSPGIADLRSAQVGPPGSALARQSDSHWRGVTRDSDTKSFSAFSQLRKRAMLWFAPCFLFGNGFTACPALAWRLTSDGNRLHGS